MGYGQRYVVQGLQLLVLPSECIFGPLALGVSHQFPAAISPDKGVLMVLNHIDNFRHPTFTKRIAANGYYAQFSEKVVYLLFIQR